MLILLVLFFCLFVKYTTKYRQNELKFIVDMHLLVSITSKNNIHGYNVSLVVVHNNIVIEATLF
jgi:hypothetical protein